jgi:hypothetical protein
MRTLKFATLAALLAVAAVLMSAPASAHHGWSWTTGGNIDLTGVIRAVSLGNPHGRLQVDVAGEDWTVEVGQPWRNERAGLSEADFRVGREIRVIGEPSADDDERRIKAERLYFDGQLYELYPSRD